MVLVVGKEAEVEADEEEVYAGETQDSTAGHMVHVPIQASFATILWMDIKLKLRSMIKWEEAQDFAPPQLTNDKNKYRNAIVL